jgi:hypothetical protein
LLKRSTEMPDDDDNNSLRWVSNPSSWTGTSVESESVFESYLINGDSIDEPSRESRDLSRVRLAAHAAGAAQPNSARSSIDSVLRNFRLDYFDRRYL